MALHGPSLFARTWQSHRQTTYYLKTILKGSCSQNRIHEVSVRKFSSSSQRPYLQDHLKWSYLQGEATRPLLGATVGQLLAERVEEHPDKEAVVCCHQGIRKTFAQLLDESDQLAAGLLELGIKRGDRVGIWSPNCWEWVVTQYATMRAGFILVNVNPAYRTGELEYALKKVGVKALISAETFKTSNYYSMLQEICPEMDSSTPGDLKSKELSDLKVVVIISEDHKNGTLRFCDVMEAGNPSQRRYLLDLQDKLQFDDPVNIQFTSGTTGAPKGALLSHHNIVNNSYFIGFHLGYNKYETRVCNPVPLYHCFGMVVGNLEIAAHGSTLVYPSASFDPEATVRAVQDEKCTSLYGTPTMFIDMLHFPNFADYDFSSLYTGVMAGSPCPVEVMKQVIEKMHMKDVTICYGTTETSPVTFQSHMTDPVDKRVSTIGRPMPHVEVKVIDEKGCILPVGQPGELCTRGYTTMLSYWDDPAKTKEVIGDDRWYKTGDVGMMEPEGYGRIVGRIKDMIIRGGENIYPVEVEQFLYQHPKIEDVQVIGVPDDRMGEEVCAWIKLKEGETATEQEIVDFCHGQIAHFKIPSYIIFTKEFPLTVTGKIQKFLMRQDMAHKLPNIQKLKPRKKS